ncbi:hypothetical protein [Streptomyces werraensis]|uniref:hypothetical protein n=1 Tax=Streptomyces werraensis TaxID=68284 RepID=UPI0037CF5FD6
MPVEPVPCEPGGGTTPVEVTTCCAPSIASAPLCLADGSTILAVVRSGCVECGEAAPDPEVVGWLDTAGAFTPGALPADAGPCDAGCLDTLCRQRCDDTDGDGQANVTYSELYCVRADGTAELVLTYQDDPTVPYTPVSPVECSYGCAESETVTLCDDTGPFLRRYTWLAGVGSFEDVALDGQTPHVVTGTVGACGGDTGCEEQTTPAATLGLCLADGTPIAVVVTRDCSGTVTQDGWLNLTTGAYSAGDPPVGTMACGNPRSITTAGTFCDIDPDSGDVLGLVLIEYTYGPEGDVAAVRLVDATTGQTYTPQGEVTTCPAGVEQPERDLVQLCDTAADGAVTAFVRDYARDEAGQVTGHSDYLLDGAPYTPTGTVGRCTEQCQDCQTVVLCDVDTTPPATVTGTAASGTLPNGVAWTSTGPSAFPPTRQSDGAAWWATGLFPNPVVPNTVWTFNQAVTVDFSVVMNWSPATGPTENQVQLPAGAVPLSLPPGYTYNRTTRILSADNTLTGCTVTTPNRAASARFRVTGVTSLSLRYLGSRAVNTDCRVFGHWTFGALDVSLGGEFARTVCRDCTGEVVSSTDTLLDGETPYTPVGLVGVCQPDAEESREPVEPDTEVVQLCDVAADGTPTPFLRRLLFPAGGGTPTVTDTALDGVTPYVPAGTVGVCQPEAAEPEPCRNSSSVLLCDVAAGTETVTPTVTSTTLAGTDLAANPAYPLLAGSWAPLWNGGALPFPQDANASAGDGVQVYRSVAGRITGTVPDNCATASGELTVSVRVTNNGPNPGLGGAGLMRLYRNGIAAASVGVAVNPPVGHVQTLTATVPVTAAELTGGALVFVLSLETFHGTPKAWTADQFTISSEFAGCEVQFLRNVITDCETGEVTAVTDTTLDGQPYTVTGEVGQCTTTGGGQCCPPEPCRNTSALLVCDLPTDGEPTPAITDTPGAPYYPYTTGVAAAGAQALWDGGTLTLPDAAGPQPGTTGTVRTAAAIIQAPRPVCDAGTARVTVQVDVTQLGPDNGCASTGFLGLYNGTGEANRIALALAPPHTPAGWSGTLTVEADVPADDLAAGNVAVLLAFDAYDDSGTVCPPPRRTGWQLSEFDATVVYDQAGCETQILRTVVTDCETGAVLTVTDTTLDGQPYAVTGEVGQCTAAGGGECCPSPEPCGDTEVAQLCDLTYDPQAPIPTPARDWTLTGNVVAANDGTTLWFAQANQPADGVAELTVSGLLPATLYEFSFASAWIGAGAPDPANNNAVYRLDILDGAAVLATRTRNVSNGSSVFPGGVLAEDLPALAFIAPATGAVTIRFTDLTTGGPVNDRDLFLMPLEVRTAALTLTATPFLRRFTFGCDGALTSTEDLDLDGVTPYEVQGEAGHCTADGGTTGTVTPCDVQNVLQQCRCDDTDGDGLPDVGYVELLGVDCAGQLTSLGTYTDGLTEPYTPVSPVDCATVDEEEGADPPQGVQARRVDLAVGASWDAAAVPALQSVTAVAHGGTGTITTADGPSTLRPGESVTWSVARDVDAALTGPLTITTVTGTVTVSWTQGVTL